MLTVLVVASTSYDEEIEEQRHEGHRDNDETPFGQDGALVHVDGRRRGGQGREPSTQEGNSTLLISHAAATA